MKIFARPDLSSKELASRLEHLLCAVVAVLEHNGLDYWLDRGTLLGAYRIGSVIRGDEDADLRVMHEDWERILDCLRAELPDDLAVVAHHHGRTIREPDADHIHRWFSNEAGQFAVRGLEGRREGTKFHSATALAIYFQGSIWRYKPNVDLYCCRINRHHCCTPANWATPWVQDGERYLCVPSERDHTRLVRLSDVRPLKEIAMAGRSMAVPARTEWYLKHLFGYLGEDAVYDVASGHWKKGPPE